MEVGELLNFKPVTAPKRPHAAPPSGRDEGPDDDEDSYERRAAAKRRKAAQKARQREEEQEKMQLLEAEAEGLSGRADANKRSAIDEHVDSVEGEESGAMTETRLKKLVLNFEKRATKNQELRIKFPDEPVKFLNSEVELHDAVQELRVIATAPDYYPDFVALGCVQSLLGLLSHENTDISVAVVDLLQEMTDADALTDAEEATEALSTPSSLTRCQLSSSRTWRD